MMDEKLILKEWQGDQITLERFAELLSSVYKRDITASYLIWKHKNNPVDRSLITYFENDKGEMVAARAFWPMYSPNAPVYQPCDTVTSKEYQGRGLFTKLTLACLDLLPGDAVLINFPNNQSLPGYLKLGWKLWRENKKVFSFKTPIGKREIDNLQSELAQRISTKQLEYLIWRFGNGSYGDYQFWLSNTQLIVSNGKQSGALLLVQKKSLFNMAPGYSQGYVLPTQYSILQEFLRGSIVMQCNSRTTYFLKDEASITTLEHTVTTSQINLLMDTF